MKTGTDRTAAIDFNFSWNSEYGTHHETYHAAKVNFWTDRLPDAIRQTLIGRRSGDVIESKFPAGELTPAFNQNNIFTVPRSQLNERLLRKNATVLRNGRFYPKGILSGLPGIFSANIQPFRCVGTTEKSIQVNFNHSLSNHELRLNTTIKNIRAKETERGGTRTDWVETALTGPGMQVRWNEDATDFFSDNPFDRTDNSDDSAFYTRPRLVQHIDNQAIRVLADMYATLLRSDMTILDLMSSWQSHLPENQQFKSISGLGLNGEELKHNPQLDAHTVHDLNKNPTLPFNTHQFDAVICSLSVEYLIDPLTIFHEVARVLKPSGIFIVSFSNRWFPPKAINIWKEMHEFERVGLVMEYFLAEGSYEKLHTYSMRGLPRPTDDKYFPQMLFSDPIYLIWGQTR
ncbi:MAG: methyltransferase domain-containing protein [Desulfobacterales bacterium]|nr:methyltransferase domain-containing protein [Desulfobacterales bacterium]